jgi:glycosyltransferase involved in cell wall biosynthesis
MADAEVAPSAAVMPPVASISVLISTYAGEQATHLEAALGSCVVQRLCPAEIVLVLDGPIPDDQQAVIGRFTQTAESIGVRFVVLPLDENVGLGAAMNAGLNVCTQPYVARMDSDDLCDPERFAVQWATLCAQPQIDLLASWQADFEYDPEQTFQVKTVPEQHEDIVRVLRWRNAVPHPSIVFKRETVVAIGGYHPLLYLEDYDLFMRLVSAGARLHAIQQPLIHVRVTRHQRERRGGWPYVVRDARFRWSLYRRGDISLLNCCVSTLVYASFRLAPVSVKHFLYSTVRRARRQGTSLELSLPAHEKTAVSGYS